MDCIMDQKISTAFRPLILSLQMTGHYVLPSSPRTRRRCQRIYVIALLLLSWSNTARFFLVIVSEDGLSGIAVVYISYFLCHLGMSYQSTLGLHACCAHMDALVKEISDFKRKYGLASNLKKVVLFQRVMGAVTSVYGISLLVALVLGVTCFTNSPLAKLFIPFINMEGILKITGICYVIVALELYVMSALAMFMPFLCFTYILWKEFDIVNKTVNVMVKSRNADDKCELIRQQHVNLVGITDRANKMMTHLLFSYYAASIPVICLLLYGTVRVSLSVEEFFIAVIVCVNSIAICFSSTIIAAQLNVKAHGCLDDLLRMDMSELSPKTLQIVSIFANRLAGPPIGYTVYGLFTVDGSTVLTIIGTLLTYAVIILQLAPEDTPPVVTNVTTIPFLNTTA